MQLRVGGVLSTVAMVKQATDPEILPATGVAPDPQAPIPKQICYIIGNEGCERFSFYGMRNILTVFLVSGVTAFQMFFFAVFAFAAALAFGFVARGYPLVDHYRKQALT